MKKFFIFLAVFALIGVAAVAAVATGEYIEEKVEFVFVSDTHLYAESRLTEESYSVISNQSKAIHFSEAVMESFADEVISSGIKYLLITGDLTEQGDEASHLRYAEILKKIADSGTEIFVINGNHDVPTSYGNIASGITQERFREIYAPYGYEGALSTFPGTLSYTADLGKYYRIIAIDNIAYYIDEEGNRKEELSPLHEEWVTGQVKAALADGRQPVLMCHKPFMNHLPDVAGLLDSQDMVKKYLSLAEQYADLGANFVFTGHMHTQDVKMITTAQGNEFFDVGISSTVCFPAAYRKVKITANDLKIDTVYIDDVNPSYLPVYATEQERTFLAEKGYHVYVENHFDGYIGNVIANLGSENGYFGEYLQGDGVFAKILNIVIPDAALKTLLSPLYISDENDGEVSLERIVNNFNASLPSSDYVYGADVIKAVLKNILAGDENMGETGELELLNYIVYGIIYNLDECSAKLQEAFPDAPVIDIDVEKLFAEGKLECYESNLVPFVIKVFNSSGTLGDALNIIKNDFSAVKNFSFVIDSLTSGYLAGVTDYFGVYDIDVKGLLEAVYNRYAYEMKKDPYPSDNFFYVKINNRV